MTSKTNNTLTVRARGKDGTFRFDVKDTDSLNSLKELISKQINVPANAIKVAMDPRQINSAPLPSNKTIGLCGIRHGDMLHFGYDTNYKSKQDEEEEEKRKKIQEELGDGENLNNLGLRHRKKNWTLADYLKLREELTIRIRHQKFGVCTTVHVDGQAANAFQLFLREMAMTVQRMGYIYGTSEKSAPPADDEEDSKAKSVDEYVIENEEYEKVLSCVIYEPRQEGSPEGFVELDDQALDRADTLANLLGMRRIGWIFSHDGDRDYPLSGSEILRAAELQSKYGHSFVTVTVFPNEEGQLEFQAFQVSKQCVELFEKGLLKVDEENPAILRTTKPVQVERKETQEVDCLLLICNVAITNYTSMFQVGFPIRNRPSSDHVQTMNKLKQVLLQRKNQKFVQRISDFHLLLFLTDYLSLSSDFPPLCEAIKTQNNSMAQNFEHPDRKSVV